MTIHHLLLIIMEISVSFRDFHSSYGIIGILMFAPF